MNKNIIYMGGEDRIKRLQKILFKGLGLHLLFQISNHNISNNIFIYAKKYYYS